MRGPYSFCTWGHVGAINKWMFHCVTHHIEIYINNVLFQIKMHINSAVETYAHVCINKILDHDR